MLRDMGFEQDQLVAEHHLIFVVRSVNVDYLKPARFNDCLDATSEIIQTKKASLSFEQTMVRGNDLLCKGNIRIACLDSDSMKPKIMPDFLLEKMTHV
jgi:acyl-CoA thioester hydrolase